MSACKMMAGRKRYMLIIIGTLLVHVFFADNSRVLSLRPVEDGPSHSSFVQLVDMNNNNRTWLVPKRLREDCLQEIDDVIDRFTYTGTNESHLDVVNGIGFHGALEMADPRSRYCLCFEEYYDIWKDETPFSGESFFDWFDYGSGKKQNSSEEDCDRDTIEEYMYYKATPKEIVDAEVEFKVLEGSARMAAYYVGSGRPVPRGVWVMVWTLDHRFLLHSEDIEDMTADDIQDDLEYKVGHCSFTEGLPVLFAGEIGIQATPNNKNNNRISWINPESGHYRTDFPQARALYQWLRQTHNISQATMEWRPWEGYDATEWQEQVLSE